MNIVKKALYGLIKKLKFLPPEFYVKIYYEYYSGRKLNLKKPVEFNEKIQWLKVYYQPAILTQLVDKYAVHTYIQEKIGTKYLNEILGVYTRIFYILTHIDTEYSSMQTFCNCRIPDFNRSFLQNSKTQY